jgi:hypothetical protein
MQNPPQDAPLSQPARRRRWHYYLFGVGLLYFGVAYLLIPGLTSRYYKHHPSLDDNPRITTTADGHPGDPLNVALIGAKEQVVTIMTAAKWDAAAALGLRSDIKIAEDTVLSRPDVDAPVSNLLLFGRKEDLAFEKAVGDNPRQRNHVRFWKTEKLDNEGGPIWIGSASYDERVGLSHTTGQITHHIAPDIDKERDQLFTALESTGELAEKYTIEKFHTELQGRNGGGDPWHTDGSLFVGVIKEAPK